MNNNFKDSNLYTIIKNVPNNPGVYQFFDINSKLLYVGKAKNLKKRVSSYFNKNHDYYKLQILVNKVIDIKCIIVEDESEALLLENSIIKNEQPRYNVLLKDDKTFPWICIKSERFPRVFLTRKKINDGSLYFGPYTSVFAIRTLLGLIKQLFKLRTCNYNLSEINIKKEHFKVCLDYHLGTCNGPCEDLETEKNYNNTIKDIKDILKGNLISVIEFLKSEMTSLAKELKFEEAQTIKEKILLLEQYKSKSTVVSSSINNTDVFSIADDDEYAYVNYLRIINGSVIQSHTLEIKKVLNETKEDILPIAITEIKQKINSIPDEILLPINIDFSWNRARIITPIKGDKKKLLDLSLKNAMQAKKDRLTLKLTNSKEKNTKRILETIKNDLKLQTSPIHIEGFDNSNIQGTHPVASCVVFRNAVPAKKDYRHFNIKTVEGANDFASMEEIIYRRYKRLIEEEKTLPQLIIIDGGKGQLSAAVKSLKKLDIYGKIAIIGIAKKLEEIYFPEDPIPLYLDKTSETLKIIQHVRNESHRFGITFHRDKRSNSMLNSELDNIEGIGEKTIEKLLKELKTVKAIKNSSFEKIASIIGKKKANTIISHFKE